MVDMVGIACLTSFAPKSSQQLRQMLISSRVMGQVALWGGQDEYKQRQEFHKSWLNELPDREREAVKGIVKRLFPSL